MIALILFGAGLVSILGSVTSIWMAVNPASNSSGARVVSALIGFMAALAFGILGVLLLIVSIIVFILKA